MMTREEVAEIITYCKDRGVTYKSRLIELGIPEWRFFESKARYAKEQTETQSSGGEFLQLSIELKTPGGTLKYRLEDEMIADFVSKARESANANVNANDNFGFALQENVGEMTYQELAVWSFDSAQDKCHDNVTYPDKVRLNCYYYRHYSFVKDIEMIFAIVLGWKIKFAGEAF